jgi:uncharacterized damage-inducible protein DinB
MSVAEKYLPELDAEAASTRRVLERVPMERFDWKPHPKSRSLGELATHVTETMRWGIRVAAPNFQVGSEKAPSLRTTEELLARFDQNVAGSRAALAARSDEEMAETFPVLRPDGSVFFQLPRKAAVRRLLLSHVIHHRGQLTVYLRLNDVPLPSVYGPTADESI